MNAFWKYLRFPLALVLVGLCLIQVFCLLLIFSHSFFDWVDLFASAFLIAFYLWCTIALFRMPRQPTYVPRSKLRWCLKIIALIAVAVSFFESFFPLVFAMVTAYYWMYANPGPFDRPRMEHIVEQVRLQDFKGEQAFILDAAGNLKKIDDHSDKDAVDNASTARPFIDAYRASDGTLSLTILTVNLRLNGQLFGFAYSDKILQPDPEPDPDDPSLDVPGMIDETTPKGKIDDHWWKVHDEVE